MVSGYCELLHLARLGVYLDKLRLCRTNLHVALLNHPHSGIKQHLNARWSLSLETLKQLVNYIPTYYGAEWSWVIHALHHIVRTAEKSFVSIPYQNEYCIYTDSDGLENDKH